MVDGIEFLISCKELEALKKVSQGQLIKCSSPSTIRWRQCDIRILPWPVWVDIESTVHVVLPKRPVNQFKPVQQRKQQALRTCCSNKYTVNWAEKRGRGGFFCLLTSKE